MRKMSNSVIEIDIELKDGHNCMYPIAYGFIDSETKDNWTWYMTQLDKALGDMSLLAVCIDACKGLEEAVKLVFPMAEQRECFKHLMDNYVKKYRGAEHMYLIGRAYRKDVHDYHMNHVYAIPKIKLFLDTYHSLKWYRSGFNLAIKCDYVTNNIVEVFNNWIKDIKDLLVSELVDKVREKIMVLWHKMRKIGEMLDGRILPTVINVLKAQTRGLCHLTVV
jgi:zinc finger SWIM domain-containing protein 3